ncbi:MAG: hypothetical protein C0392_10875 [Syntrophus sp. (in: bacteria)]|nr:hypothetical protein [Syntrophus sp. (in: bacteria)]
MTIKISDIEDELAVKGEVESSSFQGAEESDIVFKTPVAYKLTVKKIGDVIVIRGSIGCTLSLICGKCLEEFLFPVDAFLDIELVPITLMPSASEIELKGEELDVNYYEGDEIDPDPFVYEEIMLSIPLKLVCRESCKGLCETCGVNRNYEECCCNELPHTILGEKLKSFLN